MNYPDDLFAAQTWAEVLQQAYGFQVERDGPTGLPYAVLDDLAGRRLSALPFADYLPLESADTCHELHRRLTERHPGFALSLKTRLAKVADGFTLSRRAVLHRYRAGGRASSSFRRSTRTAMGARTRVQRSTDTEALQRFVQLYHWQRLRKFGSIPQPLSFFTAIHERFVVAGRGFYAEAITHDGRHAATMVVLRQGRGWFYKFGASDPDLLDDRPNNLLFTHLTEAVDAGEADFLDLGLSGASDAYAGLRRFKESTGAAASPLTYLQWQPTDYDAARPAAFKRFLGELTDALVTAEAEPALVNPLSERIYRYFA